MEHLFELNDFLKSLHGDNETKVVVVSSDVTGFFGSQIDLNLFTATPPTGVNATAAIADYYDNLKRLLSTPAIFMAEVNGRA